jgi:hypothetical protein
MFIIVKLMSYLDNRDLSNTKIDNSPKTQHQNPLPQYPNTRPKAHHLPEGKDQPARDNCFSDSSAPECGNSRRAPRTSEGSMITSNTWKIVLPVFILTVSLSAGSQTTHDAGTQLAHMAPLAQYLDPNPDAEIAMARTAAPAAISRDATVLVLRPNGYEIAVTGKNGFVCAVERAWMAPMTGPDFWNPKIRGPICFNPQAARSVLPITYKRTALALAGLSKTQMSERMKEAVDRKELPPLEPGAMSYMMSKVGYLGDSVGHWHPHLMFYSAKSDGTDWGAEASDSPVILSPQFQDAPEPLNTFIIRVPNWSDGTAGAAHTH